MRRLTLALLAIALLAIALLAIQPLTLHAQATGPSAAQTALSWMRSQQQADGAFPGFGPGDSADAALAFAAAGENPAALSNGGATVLAFLQAQSAYAKSGVGSAAKLTLAAVAMGQSPRQFAGSDLLQLIGGAYDAQTGQYGADVYGHALALLAIRAVQATAPAPAVQRVLDLQLQDGGWSFDGSAATGSDTNTTGLVMQALAGEASAAEALQRALGYLKSQQNDDGGFPYSQTSQFGSASDANSTAAVLQALAALGESPDGAAWTQGDKTPLAALIALQNSSGALRYQATPPDDNALATYQAVPALFGKALPIVISAVPGAQEAIAAPVAQPVPVTLPATGAPAETPLAALALVALVLLSAGLVVRRRAAL